MTDVAIRFGSALPYTCSRALVVDPKVHKALRHLDEQGVDLAELAAKVASGLTGRRAERRSRADINRILHHRVLRHAGMLDDDQEMTD
jgi:hypothetical protein